MVTTRQAIRRWAWGLGLAGFVVLMVWKLGAISALLLVSFLSAYVLNPLTTRLAKLPPAT